MKKTAVDIYTEKKKKKILKEGMLALTLGGNQALRLNGIPYYIDENKKVHIGVPGISYEKTNKDGTTEKKFCKSFEFEDADEWKETKEGMAKWALEDFEKEQSAAKEPK